MQGPELLHYQVVAHLFLLTRGFRAAADRALSDLGLSQATAWSLVAIGRLGNGVRQITLADQLGIEGSSLVRQIDVLVEAGLVRRQEDPEDRRAKGLHLTEAGEAQYRVMERRLRVFRATALAGASEADLQACLRVFHQTADNLGITMPELLARPPDDDSPPG